MTNAGNDPHLAIGVIEHAQLCTGREYLAPPAAKYEIHDPIGCGVHCPFSWLRPVLLGPRLETMPMEAVAGQSKDCEYGSQNCIVRP
jgi:hypothetical protein